MPPTPKNMTPNTDPPDTDSLDAAENDSAGDPDSAYLKLIHFSLRNHNRKIAPNTKTTINRDMAPNTDAPSDDTSDAFDDDADYLYSLRNHKNKKNNMTPNTDTPMMMPLMLLMTELPTPTLLS